ncbi:MAG: phage infection protein, partial [Nitrososphaerales archaeon]
MNVEIKNCYGIRSLQFSFDFSASSVYAIYAPNGVMKTSLAQTFSDVALSLISRDRVFPERINERSIKDEHGVDIKSSMVLVVRPYDQTFETSEKTSTLLVDAKLRAEYEQLYVDIEEAKDALVAALQDKSRTRKNVESEVASTFTASGDFYQALLRVEDELTSQRDAPFAAIEYDRIFSDQVLSLLASKDVQLALAEYITRYNELLESSTYFRKGTFNYFNAEEIAKNLTKNGFFDASHSVKLNAGTSLEITTEKQLQDLIQKEKDGISSDIELRRRFSAIEKLITKNAAVRDFQEYVTQNEILLAELSNIDKFREDLWKSYLKDSFNLYTDVVSKFRSAQIRRGEIEEIAKGQRTQWEAVIDIFNHRFYVPFKLYAKNRTSVILGAEPVLTLGFEFDDGDGPVEVGEGELFEVLSSGEKKALYILNIIFEIEVRKKAKAETIFVIDDIADSFDYR